MTGLLFGKSREEREEEKRRENIILEHKKRDIADAYDEMVTKALERLTRWAYPDSVIERSGDLEWQLYHNKTDGRKYVDVIVQLEMNKDEPVEFCCENEGFVEMAELTFEELNNSLRYCVCNYT
jgi:hypothetical protein